MLGCLRPSVEQYNYQLQIVQHKWSLIFSDQQACFGQTHQHEWKKLKRKECNAGWATVDQVTIHSPSVFLQIGTQVLLGKVFQDN